MVLYKTNHGTISMHLYFNPCGMINIPTDMIMFCRSTRVDSPYDICTCCGLWILGQAMVSVRIVTMVTIM